MLQSLEDEIITEEDSDWAERELNHYTEREMAWRSRVAETEEFPEEIQAEKKFLGGKQYHRALEFFGAVMVESLPDPFQLKGIAANSTGYLEGGLQVENWERAMVQITKVCMRDITHPGINYLIKHVGSILRRLFTLALEDIKQGEKMSATFKLMPKAVEKFLCSAFDALLWDLMKDAADKTHSSQAPMYSTINPNRPTFRSSSNEKADTEDRFIHRDGKYVKVPSEKEASVESLTAWAQRRISAFIFGS